MINSAASLIGPNSACWDCPRRWLQCCCRLWWGAPGRLALAFRPPALVRPAGDQHTGTKETGEALTRPWLPKQGILPARDSFDTLLSARYHIILKYTIYYSIPLYSILLIMLCSINFFSILFYSIIILYYIILYYIILYYIILYYIILYYIILYYSIV